MQKPTVFGSEVRRWDIPKCMRVIVHLVPLTENFVVVVGNGCGGKTFHEAGDIAYDKSTFHKWLCMVALERQSSVLTPSFFCLNVASFGSDQALTKRVPCTAVAVFLVKKQQQGASRLGGTVAIS